MNMLPNTIGRYTITAELGRGGMATVYRGFDPRFKRQVAIKVLPREFLHDPAFRSRFEREAETIAALEHAAIVPVYDFGEDDGQPFLVMRFMPGGSLADRLKRGPLALPEVARMVSRIASALDRAHSQGIVHRDLKPDNILFDADGEPYISDFGIAKIAAQAGGSFTATGSIIGTPAYASPEQARGDRDIDGRSDIYALGVTLFQTFSGKLPYEADTPMGVLVKHITEPVPRLLASNPSLPPACEALIQKALAKNRDERFATANEMARMLAAIAQGSPPPLPSPPTLAVAVPQASITPEPALPASGVEPTLKTPAQSSARMSWPVKGKVGLALGVVAAVAVIAALLTFRPRGAAPATPTLSSRLAESPQAPTAAQPQPSGTASGKLDPLFTIPFSGEDKEIRAVAFSPDGAKLATSGKDKLIRIWDMTNGKELVSIEGHTNSVSSIAWSPDGQKLASGSDDKTIRFWDARTGAPISTPWQGHTNFVLGVAWSRDGKRLASTGFDGQVIVWDIASGAKVSSADIGTGGLSVTWSPDSARVAASGVGRVVILEPNSGKLERLTGEWGDSWGVAWSPDGQYLAATGHDDNVHVWQVDQWKNERVLKGHADTVTSVAWSPDSKRLVSAAYDRTVRVWDIAAGTQIGPALATPGLGGGILTLDWSRDGKRLAASGGTTWVWDVARFFSGTTNPAQLVALTYTK